MMRVALFASSQMPFLGECRYNHDFELGFS